MLMVRAEVPVGGLIGASARSDSGRWFDIRRWTILGAATGIPPDIPLWLERRPPPIPPTLAASARFGMVASSISDAALFYGLAVGTLRHHLLPMVRVDALCPAR